MYRCFAYMSVHHVHSSCSRWPEENIGYPRTDDFELPCWWVLGIQPESLLEELLALLTTEPTLKPHAAKTFSKLSGEMTWSFWGLLLFCNFLKFYLEKRHTFHVLCMEVRCSRGQLVVVDFHLSLMLTLGSNLGCQSWQQYLFYTALSGRFGFFPFCFLISP